MKISHGAGWSTIVDNLAIAKAILWLSRGDEWKVETMNLDDHLTSLTAIKQEFSKCSVNISK